MLDFHRLEGALTGPLDIKRTGWPLPGHGAAGSRKEPRESPSGFTPNSQKVLHSLPETIRLIEADSLSSQDPFTRITSQLVLPRAPVTLTPIFQPWLSHGGGPGWGIRSRLEGPKATPKVKGSGGQHDLPKITHLLINWSGPPRFFLRASAVVHHTLGLSSVWSLETRRAGWAVGASVVFGGETRESGSFFGPLKVKGGEKPS